MDEQVDNNEVKNVFDEAYYVNAFKCGQISAEMASNIKRRLKDGWKIARTKISVSYFIEKDGG